MTQNQYSKYSLIVPLGISQRTDLPPGSKLLYSALGHFADKDGRCWPSQQTLATLIGVQQRQLRNLLDKLRQAGLVKWHRQHNASNVYQLIGNIVPDQFDYPQTGNILPEPYRSPIQTGNKMPINSSLLVGNKMPDITGNILPDGVESASKSVKSRLSALRNGHSKHL